MSKFFGIVTSLYIYLKDKYITIFLILTCGAIYKCSNPLTHASQSLQNENGKFENLENLENFEKNDGKLHCNDKNIEKFLYFMPKNYFMKLRSPLAEETN